MYRDAAAKRKKLLGSNNGETWKAMSKIAVTLRWLNQNEKALQVEKEIVKTKRLNLGESHPSTI